MNIFLDVGLPYCYHLNLAHDEVLKKSLEEAYQTKPMILYSLPYSLMIGILTRHFNFNNVSTPYLTFYRDPNKFDADQFKIMSHFHL